MRMRLWLVILTVAAAIGLTSCGSKRSAASEDYSAEEYIRQELEEAMHHTPQFTKALLDEAYSWRGTPYRYGGHSRSGTDCSGFIMEVYQTAVGIKLPRNSAKQSEYCSKVKRSDLEPGDLVFFATGKKGKVNHVGLYLGDGSMIHASTHGVMVSGLDEPYFKKHYLHSGRVDSFSDMVKKEKKANKKQNKSKKKK